MKNKAKKILSNFMIKIIFLFLLIDICSNYCNDVSKPILLPADNTCVMKYCTEEEFINKICIKDNNIIRNQWLNNIIIFGGENSTFSKIVNYPNGDMVAISNNKIGYDGISYFYGLKENGRPLFLKDYKENPYKTLMIDSLPSYGIKNSNGEILVVKIGSNEEDYKEYIINIQNENKYIQLYDFENEYIYYNKSNYIFLSSISSDTEYSIYSIRGSLFYLNDSDFFIYAGVFVKYGSQKDNYYLYLFKLSLSTEKIIASSPESLVIISSKGIRCYGYMTSCFGTEDGEYIFCFYIYSLDETKYKIIIFDNKLKKQSPELSISPSVMDKNIFYKCIYYEGNKGIFVYYDIIDNNGPYPVILFKRKEDNEIKDWENLNIISIKSYNFSTNFNLNDIIKLSNNYIYFASVSTDKEILYIVMLNIFDNQSKIKIRYYIIRIFGIYQYKFYSEFRLNNYKQFITLTSSYCNQSICEDDNVYYSSLIIFSYPNSTDYSKNIIDELFEKNEILDNLIFNLSLRNNVIIENNIFGYIYSTIKIKSIENCDTINLISSSKKSEITINYTLENDEDINVTFNNNDFFNCTVKYIYEVTEADYRIFEEYAENKDTENGDDNEQIFNEQKAIYSGRLSYYNLYLKDILTIDCTDNCLLCYDYSKKECIVCNNNYTINNINGEEQKICLNEENEKTEKIAELPSDESTEIFINIETDKFIDNSIEIKTDIINDIITDGKTDMLIDKLTNEQTDILIDKIIDEQTEILTDKFTEEQIDILTNKLTGKTKDTTIIKQTDKKECTNQQIISLQCQNGIVKNEQFSDLNKQVEEEFLNTYDGKETRIDTKNVKFQMKNYSSNDDYDSSISSINLGKCEEALKKQYNIPEEEHLIIYKIDIQSDDLFTTYVQYKIYNPLNLEQLDYLTVCSKETISISAPVNLNNDTKALYNSLNNSGYNLFDVNDSFYNDICATYTTQNGTDISLNDRKSLIEKSGGSLNFCQEGCAMEYFNYTTQKVKCNCDINDIKNITSLNDIEFTSDLFLNLIEGFKYSNYLVMKCYILLLDFELIKKNIGFIFFAIIFIANLILFFIYIIKGRSKINYYIQVVLKNKSLYIENRKNMKDKNNKKNKSHRKKIVKTQPDKSKNILKNKKSNDRYFKRIRKTNTTIKKYLKIKKTKTKTKTNIPPKKREKGKIVNFQDSNSSLKIVSKTNEKLRNNQINIIPIHNINNGKYSKDKNKNSKNIKFQNLRKNNVNIYKIKNKNISDDKTELNKKETKEKSKEILDLDYINYKTLNIQELNTLEYEIAILVDKRSFFEYYCALIRKNHLLIFTFGPINDYNLVSLKISSFLLQLSLYMTINAFFFTDRTMHQIYKDNGEIDYLYHLSHIIYSSLISIIINIIMRHLSLSENNILSIKIIKVFKILTEKVNEVKLFLKVKFIIFFIISFILTIFYWYFISCFCAVYTNTQIILIKDSIISFCLSMVYPFAINLIPAIFRIAALRAKNQDKKCLYGFSRWLSLLI